jgi:hypothetical protein
VDRLVEASVSEKLAVCISRDEVMSRDSEGSFIWGGRRGSLKERANRDEGGRD